MKRKGFRFIVGFVATLMFVVGCQSDFTLSSAVRTGDTLAVSLGDADPAGQDSNMTDVLLRDGDVSAEITDSGGNDHDVHVRHLFKVFADPASPGTTRGRSQWMAVIDLVDPNDFQIQPALDLGPATIKLSSAKFAADHIVNTHILSGNGDLHEFITQNDPLPPPYNTLDKLIFLKPLPQALVTITGTLPPGVELGAAEYRFIIPDEDVPNSNPNDPLGDEAALPSKLGSSKQVYFEYNNQLLPSPQNGTDVLVMMTVSEGLEQSELSNFDFLMTSEQGGINGISGYWDTHFVGATYYDTDGQEITTGIVADVGSIR